MKRKILERYLLHIATKIRDWFLFDRKKGILGWLFIGLSWLASLLSVQPPYLPLKYPELLQNVFFVVTVLSMLVAVYFIRAAERSRDGSDI
jgi:predicted membrane channel-forming protein YqfA (hemolysin III family)